MALPPGISGKTLTFGATTGFDGTPVPDGSRVAISTSKNVKHLATGRQLVAGQIVRKYISGIATFDELVPNDADGLDRYDWTYTVRFEISGASEQPEPFSFVLFDDDPQAIDGDTLSPVPSSIGTPVSVNALRLPPGGLAGQALVFTSDFGVTWADLQPAGDYATADDLADGLATKVNSSTYTAGLAGKQDKSTLGADVAADATVRAAFGPADPVLSAFTYDPTTGNLLSYQEDGVPIVLTYNPDGTVATSKRGTAATKTFTYSGGNLAGVA